MSASTRSTSRNCSARQLRRAVSFGDLTVIWAKDVADGQVKGFVVANDLPGFSTTKLEDKIALRIVQNAVITLDDVRVDEQDRLQNANTFRDPAEVLRRTRAGVAWMPSAAREEPMRTRWPTR
ncbi:MAG: glutaryl-CoA dehydrogenase [Mycobacterium sp.]|nr:glutaryl-CoA dehydrogenase [Mycobacterium sp.]MDT5283098.1 glutaryl-CoA dehydrogenase [Mycobacterium sp.]